VRQRVVKAGAPRSSVGKVTITAASRWGGRGKQAEATAVIRYDIEAVGGVMF
jgi:hypothetical protein